MAWKIWRFDSLNLYLPFPYPVLMIISTTALWLGRFGGFEMIKRFFVKVGNKNDNQKA